MIAKIIVGFVKSLITRAILKEVFIMIAKEFAKDTETQIDDNIVDILEKKL